ncbi:hypothetical protein [Spirosoma pulveris]
MNQGFKLRFDQLRENDPTGSGEESGTLLVEQYPSNGHTRNVCLVWPDGRRVFLNYAYLIAGEYEPNDEKNVIKLSFSSHSVTLQGYNLEPLFMALLDHLPRIITAIDPRYVLDEDRQDSVVISIVISPVE